MLGCVRCSEVPTVSRHRPIRSQTLYPAELWARMNEVAQLAPFGARCKARCKAAVQRNRFSFRLWTPAGPAVAGIRATGPAVDILAGKRVTTRAVRAPRPHRGQ